MIFNSETRALTSISGYFKNKITNKPYNRTIYLGKFDSPNNYISITKEDYIKILVEKELDKNE